MKVTIGSKASADVPLVEPQESLPLTSGARISGRHRIWPGLAGWLVFGWALIELPVELRVSTTWREAVALLCAKVLFFVVVLAMACGAGWAKAVFLGVCAMSVLAITPTLPGEFQFSPIGAALSTGEVVIKFFAFLIVALGPSKHGQ
jgi:bacteriorhodopsin